MLVADLNSFGASAPSIEVERRKLRVLELMRFKEFRQTMLEKLKRKATAVGKGGINKSDDDGTTTARLPSSSFLQTPGNVSKRGSIESHPETENEKESGNKRSIDPETENEKESGNKSIAANSEESVDINIDVQVNIESGQCILRANPTFTNTGLTSNATQASLALSKRPSARDLKAKAFAATHCITKLAIPSVDVKVFYTSNDATAAT
uniref:Uncharacterized protein n=1 Tax=Panagrolaimus sp. PS1159 TaxID=55785 RepID=A0AC35FL02_9BILA